MSVQEQGAQLVTARAAEIRPAVVLLIVKVARMIVSLISALVFGDLLSTEGVQVWARVERVSWFAGPGHVSPRPVRCGNRLW